MNTYTVMTPDYEDEVEAASESEAVRVASERIRADCAPDHLSTYWIYARLYDEEGTRVADWVETIDPVVPHCDPPPELEGASADELAAIWGAEIEEEEDGHVWARPHSLLGGIEENPGVQLSGAGVVASRVCLRCGTLMTIDTDATDPGSGHQGLKCIEYDLGCYEDEVEAAWAEAQG